MPYTWTGASALGHDLAVGGGGAPVAAVLLCALAADADYARHLAMRPAAPPRVRARATALVMTTPRGTIVDLRDHPAGVHDDGPLAEGTRPDGTGDPARELARVARRVRSVRFGGPADLLELLHGDGLVHLAPDVDGATRGRAVRRLADALLAARLGGNRSDPGMAALAHAVRTTPAPPTPDLGPYGGDVRDLLDGVRAGGRAGDPYRLGVLTRAHPVGEWSRAMHVASWAVELSGRTRPAAAAQLLAVLALAAAGFTADDCAGGVWNALSGAVTARLVADLLPDAEHRLLAGEG